MNRSKAKLLSFIFLIIICCVFRESILIAENGEVIPLPKAKIRGSISLEEAISRRRSVRRFQNKEMSMEQISQLLWSAQGITGKRGRFRAAPSAGALYPIEIYLVKSDGIFHYEVDSHSLAMKNNSDVRGDLMLAALSQPFVKEAPVSIIIAAVRSRVTSRYGGRGNRYVEIEVGHVAENVHLQAVALGLATVPVGAFDDDRVSRVLSLPKNVEPLYIIPVGYEK
jgi:SagB-type dehydrogenase family enzyme